MIVRLLKKCLNSRNLSSVVFKRANHYQLSANIRVSQQTQRFSSSEISDHETNYELEAEQGRYAKEILYPDSSDVVIKAVKNFSTSEEFKNFLKDKQNLQKEHVCQLILCLWDYMKSLDNTLLLELEPFVSRIDQYLNEMTTQEVCFSFHYLNRLGLSIKHPTMERMNDLLLHEIKSDENFPLLWLTHYTYSINTDKGLYSSVIAVATQPHIVKRLENCSNADDLFLIIDALNNISHIVSLNLLNQVKNKVDALLDNGLLNEGTSRTILKVVNFLNYPHWSFRNTTLIRKLLLQLEDNIKFLKTRHLMTINRAFQSQLESARLVPLLVKRAQQLLSGTPSVELLSLAVLNVTPDQREKIAAMLHKFLSMYQITSTQSGETLQTVFKILRLLKISDVDLCDQYWLKVLNEIYGTKQPSIIFRLSKHIHKYMFFNNNLGGTYRHKEFEKSMIEMVLVEMKRTFIPKEFAVFASFIIGYGDGSGKDIIPQSIVNKIEALHEQFSVKDCLQLSRGIQILNEQKSRRLLSRALQNQIDSIDFSLKKSARRHIKGDSFHLSQLNAIIRTYNNRKSSKGTFLFHKMISFYDTDEKLKLNSRGIRDIAYNLTLCNYRMDKICDRFIDYVLDNHDHVTGDTVEKILTICYNFSYFPEKIEVFDRSSEIIIRDFNYMNGLSIVQALLALIFYKSCPQQLIAMVFSSDFIKRLEQEIAMCYSKNTYPQKVMNQVMQLNRAVCLDCPEVNVKWFQQSYMEAQDSKLPRVHSRLHNEVKSVLLDIVKGPEFLTIDRVTPYGYRVDFELTVDQYNRFVHPLPEDYHHVNYSANMRRIAILLLSNKVLCDNDINRLKGSELLRMRHLEMMGYRVIHVKISEFNSLYKNVSAKIKYLKNLLQLNA